MKKIAFLIVSLSSLLIALTPLPAAQENSDSSSPPPPSPHSSSATRRMAGGVKQVVYDGPKEFTKETAADIPKKPPIVSMVEGVNKGTEKLVDHTIKGAYKVATLGHSELKSYEVVEPKKNSDETTRFKISIPGT